MSKLRIEKLKQGVSSNNDVLVYRNDLGTFQGQSNVVLNTITLGGNTVNSSVYTGTSLNANSTTYFGGQLSTYYANATVPGTAYSNAVTYAGTIAGTAYANAVIFANTIANTAYTNAIATAASDATTKAATAYTNAASYADTKAGAAFTNAVSYAAANSYVNTQLGLKADLAGATFTGAVIVSNTLAAGNTTITGFANVTANLQANNIRTTGSVQIDGDLVVSGNTVQVNVTNLSLEDNMIYLNANNTVSHPDLGFAGNYNDGTYRHAGFFRDATDGVWKLFDQYTPEPDASAYIDTANASFRIADFQANTVTARLVASGNTTVTGFINVSTSVAAANINTTGTVSADIITVANVAQTQTNLQVDPAGSAFLNAIIYG